MSKRPLLGAYILVGIAAAIGLCVLAVLGISLFFVMKLLGAKMEPAEPRDLLYGLPIIFLSCFCIGVIGAVALWVLYPLRKSLVGYMIRGAVVTPLAYGVIGLSSVLLYVRTGVDLIDYDSPEDAWRFLRWSLPIFATLGAFLGGPVIYFQNRGTGADK